MIADYDKAEEIIKLLLKNGKNMNTVINGIRWRLVLGSRGNLEKREYFTSTRIEFDYLIEDSAETLENESFRPRGGLFRPFL